MRLTIAAWNRRKLGGTGTCCEHAVDAVAQAELVLERLDVHVGRAHLDRLGQHLVDEADDRRVLGGVASSRSVSSSSSRTWSSPRVGVERLERVGADAEQVLQHAVDLGRGGEGERRCRGR